MDDNKHKYKEEAIHNRLKDLRKLRGFTQEQLADIIGVKRQTVIDWERENNYTIPSVRNLIDICYHLECSLDYLLGTGDSPEIDPIAKASHYSGISKDIIKYGIDHDIYLGCLNFFMHPDNSKDIFNELELLGWKNLYNKGSLKVFNEDLKELLIKYYDEYVLTTPIYKVDKISYKKFIMEKFPEKEIKLSGQKTESGFHLKKNFVYKEYQNFYKDKKFDYNTFIEYIVEHTFESLSHRVMIDIQTKKIAESFTGLILEYITNDSLLPYV